jgi:hypothetical protein
MRQAVRAAFSWKQITDDELLDVRLCDLPVRIEGTPLEERVRRIRFELDESGLRLRPHVWLGEEWFTPDGVAGFAIPFYLAHPRLMRLERRQMLEVEGGTERECLRIMRHEAAHALDNAFLFRKRRRWRELFGSFKQPYPDFYQPDPTSREYVLHLGAWYAQAHPAEDFAETFSVWLTTPRGRWRRIYEGWGALRKLEYVDRLMQSVVGLAPKNRRRDEVEPISQTRTTLREYYRRKRERYAFNWPPTYDRDLRNIFSDERRFRSRPTAASFLRRSARELVQTVAAGTGIHQYTISQLLGKTIDRCKLLRLRLTTNERQARQQALVMLAVQTMNVVHKGYYRIPV